MAHRLIGLKTVAFDTQRVPAAGSATFFSTRQKTGAIVPIDEPYEPALVRWVFEQPQARALLVDVLDLGENTRVALNAGRPFATGDEKPGDIDVILCDPSDPAHAVALECKRIKVSVVDESGGQKVTKLSAFGSAYAQANALGAKPFSRTYLAALAVVDGRALVDRNFFSRGAAGASFQRIFDVAMRIPLDESVGVIYVELVQPEEAPFHSAAVVSAAVIRPAAIRDQGEHFTATVLKYLTDNNVPARRGIESDIEERR